MVLSHLNDNPKQKDYFHFWIEQIHQIINKRLFHLINQTNPDIIIDFHRNLSAFQRFLTYYNLNEKISVIYWLHSSKMMQYWQDAPQYSQNILNKYTHFIAISDEMKK
ncbi:hypothetical protein ACLSY5_10365, partial [Avibacterium avium]|uniref:hypothetical protein n=1 Tax=Avibacterium avium TaxID=751 RepID=UPI003BF87139